MDHSEVKHLPKVDHTPAELDDDSKLLLKGAAVIEQCGHLKDRLYEGSNPEIGPVCLIGSLYRAFYGSADHHSNPLVCERILKLAGRVYGGNAMDAVSWNNAPERTKDEVVAKLRAVALGL